MFRRNFVLPRGYTPIEQWGGNPTLSFSLKKMGGVPRLRPIFKDFTYVRPARPYRAIANKTAKSIMLYNKADQLELVVNALAIRRTEHQVELALNQLAIGVRNAEEFIEKHLLKKETRPSLHTLFFHERGLVKNSHVFHSLATHHMVPLLSLLSYDLEQEKMTFHEVEEVFHAATDVLVGHSPIAQREVYNHYIRACALSNQPEKAFEAIEEMQRKGIRRTFVTYAPLYRLARQNTDVELHLHLEELVLEMEGGRFQKKVWIDFPRVIHVFWVFVRYMWGPISACLIMGSGLMFSLFLVWTGLA